MKILFTTEIIQRAGKERQMLLLSRELLRRGDDVRILSIYATPMDFIQEYGIGMGRIDAIENPGLLQKFRKTRKYLQQYDPDIVFAWDPLSALFALLVRRKIGFALINGSIQHGVWLWKPYYIFRSLVGHISPFVVSNSLAGLRANRLKTGNRRMVLPNGVEDKFINRLPAEEISRKRKEQIPGFARNPGTVFISVANFVPFKDYDTVLDAMERLKGSHSFYYLILGEGPLKKEVAGRIREKNLGDRVFLLGKVERVPEYLHISDCMIHSSRGEGISNSILEAMFAGLPVIATNVGGIPETVFPGSSMLFPYRDQDALFQCLRRFDELKAGFDPLSEEYRNHLAKFSVDRMVDRFQEIVNVAMADRIGKGSMGAS